MDIGWKPLLIVGLIVLFNLSYLKAWITSPSSTTLETNFRKAMASTELAQKYFDVWNSQNLDNLKELFAENAELRDWDVHKFGRDEVVAANGGIFKAVPNIKIDVLKVHVSGDGSVS